MNDVLETDVLVLGSGVAGLTAALTAVLAGQRVIVVEHQQVIGGTSARSSGTVWIPDNHYLREHGVLNDRELATRYLSSLVANQGAPEMWQAFLDNGPAMLVELEKSAGIAFRPYMHAADYRQDKDGAAPGGRALEPLAFDGRLLGADFERLGWPIREHMVFGGMMVTRAEALMLLRADRSLRALIIGVRLVGRFLLDRLSYARGTRLVIGNALVARLFKAASDRGAEVMTGVESRELIERDGRICGAVADAAGRKIRIEATRGVILAGGGFPADARLRKEHLPEPVAEFTAASEGCDGSTISLALRVGAALGADGLDNALWFPSSVAARPDGSTAVYPHIVLDRAKPGMIAVDQAGRRFVNEAVSYHEFVRGMYRANRDRPAVPAWLICDHDCIRGYGLGLVRPRGFGLRKSVRSGYLTEAGCLEDLARRIGVPEKGLLETVERYNQYSATGVDPEFGKGETIYERANGDPDHKPNPCIGTVSKPPFYAVALYPTPLGTSRGLVADENGRVCDSRGEPINGLYVCGNDMQSAFGGEYPGAGGQLGQAMTFAWLAARHAAGAGQPAKTVDGRPPETKAGRSGSER